MTPVDKLERLMNLVAALLHTRVPLAAADLQHRVGGYPDDPIAFHRQFERDKKDLREMGVPIRNEPVPDLHPPVTGYRIDPDEYYLADPGLEPDEVMALQLATRLIAVDGADDRAGLFKLGGLATPEHEGRAADPPWTSVPIDPNLATLFDAIHRSLTVTFAYRDRNRRLAPRALGFRTGRWYVTGHDLDAGDDRVFRLDRIDGLVEPGEAAPPEATTPRGTAIGPMDPWRIGGEEPVTVTVRVDPVAVPAVTAHLNDEQVVARDADGTITVELEVTNPDGFRAWILGFGAGVEVTAPDTVRDDLVAWLDAVAREAS